jgi:hypothetical protein
MSQTTWNGAPEPLGVEGAAALGEQRLGDVQHERCGRAPPRGRRRPAPARIELLVGDVQPAQSPPPRA